MANNKFGSIITAGVFSISALLMPNVSSAESLEPSQAFAYQKTQSAINVDGALKYKMLFDQYEKTQEPKQTNKPQKHWIHFVATWYDGQEGINGTGNGITKSGARVKDNWTIAVDPNVIPLGSKVIIKFKNGRTHEYKAEDTGGAIQGNRIDIFNSSYDECIQNGIQGVSVYFVTKGQGAA